MQQGEGTDRGHSERIIQMESLALVRISSFIATVKTGVYNTLLSPVCSHAEILSWCEKMKAFPANAAADFPWESYLGFL